MVIPIAATLGQWAWVKGTQLASRLRTFNNLARTEEVAGLLAKAENAGALVVEDLNKVVIKDGENITTISKNGDEIIISKVLNEAADISSAREFVRNKYGQNVLNKLTTKFGSNDGAAAVILQKWGDDGLTILNNTTVNTLDDAAKELLKGKTAYRHVSSDISYLEQLKTTGKVPQNVNNTYFTLDKFDDPLVAIDKMQLNVDATDGVWRLEFDTNQLVGKATFPKGKWNNLEYIEVLTRSYPNFGSGGASQFITQSEITLKRIVNLKTGQVINF